MVLWLWPAGTGRSSNPRYLDGMDRLMETWAGLLGLMVLRSALARTSTGGESFQQLRAKALELVATLEALRYTESKQNVKKGAAKAVGRSSPL